MKPIVFALIISALMLTACGGRKNTSSSEASSSGTKAVQTAASQRSAESSAEDKAAGAADAESIPETNKEDKDMQLMIAGTPVTVEWENNESVSALKELCRNGPLSIQMSMYGGFEQVGSIGAPLPRNDVQTTTSSGDIVLYSGDRIVIFYGSNSWAYTRLGHITDSSGSTMEELLGSGDVSITVSY